MTECERLVKEGIISSNFLNPETRNEFYVDENRKKLWAIMFDMLLVFDKFCKKHNLTYFLWSGSLLGAVRHKGCIPWDDDIDVIMPRKDYEFFLDHGEEFNYGPYFFQTPETDPGYFYSFAKIRNSKTTGIVEMFKYQKFNHGIWLSVLPLDRWDPNGGEERYSLLKKLIVDNSTCMRMTNPELDEKNRLRVQSYNGDTPMNNYKKILEVTGHTKNQSTGFVAHDSCTIFPYSKAVFYESDFADAIYWDVEEFKFPIPIGYDRILKTMYGDYMQFPPVEERGKWHAGTFFDPDKSYLEYLK